MKIKLAEVLLRRTEAMKRLSKLDHLEAQGADLTDQREFYSRVTRELTGILQRVGWEVDVEVPDEIMKPFSKEK